MQAAIEDLRPDSMMSNTATRTPVTLNRDPAGVLRFVAGTQTTTGKATYYNLAEDQRQAMRDAHAPVLETERILYALMALLPGATDINKLTIAHNLLSTPCSRDQKRWENQIILQSWDNMQANRVLNFIRHSRVNNARTRWVMKTYLRNNNRNLALWAIKYRRQFKMWCDHLHLPYEFHKAVRFAYGARERGRSWGVPLLDAYAILRAMPAVPVTHSIKTCLKQLPFTIAEGFVNKFNLSRADLLELFSGDDGGKMTVKEKSRQAREGGRVGVDTGFDIKKADLFDALVHYNGVEIPDRAAQDYAGKVLLKAARRALRAGDMNFGDVGVVLDTSASMAGTEAGKDHPLLRSVAISYMLKVMSHKCTVYHTAYQEDRLIPKPKKGSNYAKATIDALKGGHDTIFIVGDGYENTPFEGALQQVLFTFKKKIDTENQVPVIHLNPVFAAEQGDVRQIASLAPTAAIRDHKSVGAAVFLGLSKTHPEQALMGYMGYLKSLQNEVCSQMLPGLEESLQLAESI